MLAAIVLLLVEVLERRVRILSAVKWPTVSLPTVRLGRRVVSKPAPVRVKQPKEEAPPVVAPPPPQPDALIDALKKAGGRAKRRT